MIFLDIAASRIIRKDAEGNYVIKKFGHYGPLSVITHGDEKLIFIKVIKFEFFFSFLIVSLLEVVKNSHRGIAIFGLAFFILMFLLFLIRRLGVRKLNLKTLSDSQIEKLPQREEINGSAIAQSIFLYFIFDILGKILSKLIW